MIYEFFLLFAPLSFLLIYTLLPKRTRRLSSVPIIWTIILMLVMVGAIAEFPPELNHDKPRYASMFYQISRNFTSYEYRDYGWIVYNEIVSFVVSTPRGFFWITALIYVFSYYIFSRRMFSKDGIAFFVVMSMGCLGFSNYGTNVIRSGVAIGILLFCVSSNFKLFIKILLAVVAVSVHKSMLIPIAGWIASKYINKTQMVFIIWCMFLFLSVSNVDLSFFFESIGFIDERVDTYVDSMEEFEGSYQQGFRFDFLVYSCAPMAIYYYFSERKNIVDKFYARVFKTYLLVNAVWLLVIRMAYTDRMAYLSWFMIPFITLYPLIKYPHKFAHPQTIIYLIMYMFMGVRVMLSIKGFLQQVVD